MSLAVLFSQNKGKLRKINICRIYLQSILTADICNFDGTLITQKSYDGTFVMKKSNISWPNQHRPSKGGWLVWRRFLGSFSSGNIYILQPLGSWNDLAVLHHDHEWYIFTPQRALIQKRDNQWFLHERQGRGNTHYSSRPRVLLLTPYLCSIAQVKVHRTYIECIDDIVITQPSIQHIPFSCRWRTQYERLPYHLRRIIGPCPPLPQCSKPYPHPPTFALLVTVPLSTPLAINGG
jgi:hypothetical protein